MFMGWLFAFLFLVTSGVLGYLLYATHADYKTLSEEHDKNSAELNTMRPRYNALLKFQKCADAEATVRQLIADGKGRADQVVNAANERRNRK